MKKTFQILCTFFSIVVLIAFVSMIIWSIVNKSNGNIVSSGEKRAYLLYVPESYDPSVPTPLVINIHGFAQWPANQMKVSQWNRLSEQYGFIVVYPSGTGFPLRWRASEDPSNPGGIEKEITFFSDMIDKLEDEFTIDSARIYASGLSNGGGMAIQLTCHLSERITAVGSVAGAYLFSLDDCQSDRPVPAIFFHGQKDDIVPYYGGPSQRFELPFPNVPEFVESYAQKNGCDLTAKILLDTVNVKGIRFSDCEANADVLFYSIADGGHTWPGGSPLPERITGKTSQEINATNLMWEFFQGFSFDE